MCPGADRLEIPSGPSALPKRRRRWRLVLACLFVLLAIPVGCYVYLEISSDWDLQQAIAQTDRLDPRWRFADIIADRAVIPDQENPALVVLNVAKLLGPTGFDLGGIENDRLFLRTCRHNTASVNRRSPCCARPSASTRRP
jgi:hypothetical protein